MKFVITVEVELEAPEGATHYDYQHWWDSPEWYKFTPARAGACEFDRWANWSEGRGEWMHIKMAPLSDVPVGAMPIPEPIKPQTP